MSEIEDVDLLLFPQLDGLGLGDDLNADLPARELAAGDGLRERKHLIRLKLRRGTRLEEIFVR